MLGSAPRKRGGQAGQAGRSSFTAVARTDLVLLAGIGGLAFLIRLVPVLRGGGLYGLINYDDGVYFGSAVALVHGRIPYRDFLLLHPPGILYILAPFAALGGIVGDATAFATARFGFMVLGAANTGLVVLVASRLGRRTALFAGLLYAVWQVAANVERTTWLIAPQNSLLLLALLALAGPRGGNLGQPPSIRRSAIAGALLGFSFAIQAWGAVPIAVVMGSLLFDRRRRPTDRLRPAIAFGATAAIVTASVCLPFLLVAGPQMVRYVVFDQLGRSPLSGSIVARFRAIEGLPISGALASRELSALAVVAFVAVAVLVAWGVRTRPAIRLWTAIAAAQIVVLFLTPVFHYPGWLAPAGALAIAGSADAAIERARESGRVAGAVVAAYALGLVLLLPASFLHPVGSRLQRTQMATVVADARCVASDSPAALIETGTLTRDLQRGCPLLWTRRACPTTTASGPRSRARTIPCIRRRWSGGTAVPMERCSPAWRPTPWPQGRSPRSALSCLSAAPSARSRCCRGRAHRAPPACHGAILPHRSRQRAQRQPETSVRTSSPTTRAAPNWTAPASVHAEVHDATA